MTGYSYAKSKKMTRYAGWLPSNPLIYSHFMNTHHERSKVGLNSRAGHEPAVAAFAAAIREDPEMVDLFDQVFLQAAKPPDIKTIDNFEQLLYAMDAVVVVPPSFYIAKDENGNVIGEPIGVPLYLLFDLLSNTAAAYDLFRKPAFNAALKTLLDVWGTFLASEGSNSTLTDADDGWFGRAGLLSLEEKRGDFNLTYITPEPQAVNRGYRTWDEFFVRQFQPDARKIEAEALADPSLIFNACESTVYNTAENVQKHDRFWLKAQHYSLYDIFNRDDEEADKFVGGTVYQAFLSPQDYHRWHSPIHGTVRKIVNVPGTYYAVLPDEGAPEDDPDLKPGDPHGAMIRSQGWLSVAAARALIFIEADNPVIGEVCFVGIGMVEVSTCEITVTVGQKVKPGDEIGMFHFGGSTHTVIFAPSAKITFQDEVKKDTHIWINTILAQATPVLPGPPPY